jgi:hypothetical protein
MDRERRPRTYRKFSGFKKLREGAGLLLAFLPPGKLSMPRLGPRGRPVGSLAINARIRSGAAAGAKLCS